MKRILCCIHAATVSDQVSDEALPQYTLGHESIGVVVDSRPQEAHARYRCCMTQPVVERRLDRRLRALCVYSRLRLPNFVKYTRLLQAVPRWVDWVVLVAEFEYVEFRAFGLR